ncbi:hypothetical protein BH23CHL5_BH23CHL5_03980 [soil metagenome]
MNKSTHSINRPIQPQLLTRWECTCQDPPILLGAIDSRQWVGIKLRDRAVYAYGSVIALCPKCGQEHRFESEGDD